MQALANPNQRREWPTTTLCDDAAIGKHLFSKLFPALAEKPPVGGGQSFGTERLGMTLTSG